MKIIHCADLHIDCKKFSKFTSEKRALKRHQMLQNFVDMVDFAEKNKVTAILLCGDIFEEQKVLKKSLKVVQNTILEHKDITFFYIWGNHDENFTIFDDYPSNFVVFGKEFSKVDFGDVCIGGVSFQRTISPSFYESIAFQKSDFNIMMMHGPIEASDKYSCPIQLKKLDGKNIDYLALGHIHKKDGGKIDRRGEWAYCGCLESGSFSYVDDDYGFYLLDIKDGKLQRTFVPFAKYKYRSVEISVSNLKNVNEVFKEISLRTSSFGMFDIVRIVLTGQRKEGEEINKNLIYEKFNSQFFYLEVEDETKIVFDLEKYAKEKLSLKAEFVKEVMSDEMLSEEEKQQICVAGLEALKGEEISL